MGACKKTYSTPTFNLTANIWRFGVPTGGAPSLTVVAALGPGAFTATALSKFSLGTGAFGGMWMTCPRATDVQDAKNGVGPDSVEIPAGSGRFYQSIWVDDVGVGYANEHRFAELYPVVPWPTPFPPGTGGGPPPPPGPSLWAHDGQGSSIGAPVMAFLLAGSLATTAGDLIVVTVATLGGAAPGITATIGGPVLAPSAGPVTRTIGLATVSMYSWWIVSPGGLVNTTIAIPFPGKPVQCSQNWLSGAHITHSLAVVGQDPPVAPFLTINTVGAAVQGILGSFVQINTFGFPGYAAPFVQLGPDILDFVGGNNYTLNNGGMVQAMVGAYSANQNLRIPAGWAGAVDSWS